MPKSDIKVSIFCITYNHEKFLAECIDSLLSQKTNFSYEIIVHDDASTDNTTKILAEYAKKYPQKIIPLYEKINQYSKNPHFFFNTMLPYANGKYIAFCEGDDYWTDNTKLQQQYDYMEKHPNCSLCFHNADNLYMDSMEIRKSEKNIYNQLATPDNKYTSGNIQNCHFATRSAVPSASEFFRKKDIKNLPKYFYYAPCADFPLELYLSHIGYAYYMPKSMSIYRRNTGESVTDKWGSTPQKEIKKSKAFIKFLNAFNTATQFKYNEEIKLLISSHRISLLIAQKQGLRILFNKDYRKLYRRSVDDHFFIKLILKSYFPSFFYGLKSNPKFKKYVNR